MRNVGAHRVGDGAWARWIPGYPKYRIDNRGRVWSSVQAKRARASGPYLVQTSIHKSTGYVRVNLWLGDVRVERRVHKLVLLAWQGPPKPGQQARHLNGIKTDNRPQNLRWGTALENARDRERHRHERVRAA